MRLREVQIHNYKSLRHVSLSPSPLTVLIGPNAAGKTNLCDALDFLGEAYRLGLEMAVARKGGYENICYRRLRRSKDPISFTIKFELDWTEWDWRARRNRKDEQSGTIFEHSFAIRAESQNIKAPFYIASEQIKVALKPISLSGRQLRLPLLGNGQRQYLLSCSRKQNSITHFDYEGLKDFAGTGGEPRFLRYYASDLEADYSKARLPSTEFLLSLIDRAFWGVSPFKNSIGSLRVFQLNPRNCRESGVPTPNPELDRFGGNLPAVVEFLKTRYPQLYSKLMNTIRRAMPSLHDLETQYTHRKTLGLFVSEEGFGRPWAAEDISDGTIQTIALLAAAYDPRTHIIVVEEPENSVHPWALRNFVAAAREASETKQVLLTTHSPILIDQLKPAELWVVRRPQTETIVTPILQLDPSLAAALGKGRFTLSEYLDSGAIREAVPAE